jgi:membrane associated rhomboid family serine protease
MSAYSSPGLHLPRPGLALRLTLILLSACWLGLALGMNFLGLGADLVRAIVLSPDAVLGGQVWRLFTSPLVHVWSGPGAIGHILTSLIGLYFLGVSLEDRWGAGRMAGFLVAAAASGGLLQVLGTLLLPSFASASGASGYFGAMALVEAVAVAWALQNRRAQVRLFFLLPVSGSVLLAIVVGFSVLHVITQSGGPEGLFAPFGGMLSGWLLSDESPLRRHYLRWKLRRLNAETQRYSKGAAPTLRSIDGGRAPRRPSKYDLH